MSSTHHFLRIDESPTEQENDRIVQADPKLRDHLNLVHTAYDLLPVLIRHVIYKDDSELPLLRLAVRLFNSAASALKLCSFWLLSAIAFNDS
jgi:hypothetical protein